MGVVCDQSIMCSPYPIHSSMGGKFGGRDIKGDARNFNRSSTEYTPDMLEGCVGCVVLA